MCACAVVVVSVRSWTELTEAPSGDSLLMQNAVTERSAQAAVKRAKGTAKGDNPATKYQGSVLKAVRMDGPTPRSVTNVSMGRYSVSRFQRVPCMPRN